MAAEQLQIKVQADVQNAISGLNNLNAQLQSTSKESINLGSNALNVLNNQLQRLQKIAANPNLSTEQYQRLSKLINTTAKEADNLSKSIQVLNRQNGTLTGGTGQATFALQNFGRVASDAPFGLIGIANNIDPLVQSFVQLRKETGSGKAALAALTSSLTGSGGLILAVSLVTSALQFAQIGLSRWGASSKKAKEEQDELAKSFGQQYTQVLLLRKAYEQDKSLDGRREILSQLNQVSDKYFGNLKAEETSIKQLENAYKGYIDNLLQSFAVKQLEQNLEPLVKQLAVQESTIKKLQPTVQKLGLAYKDLTGLTGADLESAKKFNKDLQDSFRNLSTEQRKALAPSGVLEYNQAVGQSETLWKQINKLIEDATLLYSPLDKKGKDNKATIDDITKLLSKYREELKGINWDEQNKQIDGTNERVKLASETLKSLYLAGVKETSAAWKEVSKDFDNFADLVLKRITKISKAYDDVAPPKEILPTAPDLQGLPQGNERGFVPMPKESVDAALRMSGLIGAVQKQFDALNKVQGQNNKYWQELKITPEILKQIGANVPIQQITAWAEKNNEILAQQRMLAEVIQGAISPAIDAVFKAFEEGKNPFDALIDSVRQFTVELGKAIVKQLLFNTISNVIAPGAGGAGGGFANFLEGFLRGDRLRLGVTRQ